MASAFNSDPSYRKLPPIRKGNAKETCTATKDIRNPSTFSRETHGLVRLPPIIRVDGSLTSHEPNDVLQTENCNEHSGNFTSPRFPTNYKNEKDDYAFNNSNNSEYTRTKEGRRRSRSLKRETMLDSANSFNEFINDSHLDEDSQKPSISLLETDKGHEKVRRGSKPLSLLGATHSEQKKRRGSLIFSETEKPLQRGRRLAKSSPDLSSSRKQYSSSGRVSHKSRLDSQLFHANNADFIRVATDHGNPRRLGKMKLANRNVTLQKEILKGRWEFPPQPQSSPCTPVIELTNEEETLRDHQRSSLGDIYNLQSKETRPLLVSQKKLPATEENLMDGLMIEGKPCRQNERLTPSSLPLRTSQSFLKIPQTQSKRDSLYDLQQILSVMNTEDKSGTRKKSSSSVYDLKEFLEISHPNSGSSAGEGKPTDNNQANSSGLINSHEIANLDARKGSTYDLLEFLNLNGKVVGRDHRVQENVTGTNPPDIVFHGPNEEQSDVRRPSAYDLMEFLSLSRQNDKAVKSGDQNRTKLKPAVIEIPTQDKTSRKDSIYDLEEFLSLSHKRNDARSKVTDKESSSLLSARFPSTPTTLRIKRESIYDLQEFLGVLQKESELKRQQSTESLEPIQSSFETETLKPTEEQHKGRSLSIYDLREFLSIYSTQSNKASLFQRKPSEISQSSIMINVSEDEHGNSSVDDVFLAVPVEGGTGRKRSSVASVSEFNDLLTIINDTARKKTASDAPGSLTRHDSGGAKSLLDLGEFLSVLNSDDSPLRRRLSSVSDTGGRSPSSLSRNDSSGGSSLYDLEEFLAIVNDNGQVKGAEEDRKHDIESNEISIAVPQLLPRPDRKDQIAHLSSLSEVNKNTNDKTAEAH